MMVAASGVGSVLVADLSLVHDRGGSGEPLVLVHGIGSCWRCWDPIVPLLREHHEVIALDLPGYGESPAVKGEPTVYAITDALDEALVAAGLEDAHLVGNSMGGWIVAELAGRGHARSAVAISPGGPDDKPRGGLGQAPARALARRSRSGSPRRPSAWPARARAGRSSWARSTPSRGAPRPTRWPTSSEMLASSESFPDTLAWVERTGAQPRDLDTIDCPFRILWGTRDLILPYRQAKRWVEIVPGAELVTLQGLGHLPMPDDPELVAETILEVTAPRRATRQPQPAAAPA